MGASLKKKIIIASFILLILAVLGLTGCASSNSSNHGSPAGETTADVDSPSGEPSNPAEAKSDKTKGESSDNPPKSSDKAPQPQPIQSGLLTAGEWSDLKNWDWWLRLMNHKEWSIYQEKWGLITYQRVSVVVQSEGKPVQDARVILSGKSQNEEWIAKTNNKGEAELFVNLFNKQEDSPYQIRVVTSQEKKTINNISINQKDPLFVELNSKSDDSSMLDLMFVVDTTGSMGDELEYLAEELKDVIKRIKIENDNDLNIRISTNFYRDHHDEYLVLPFKFTEDVDKAARQISEQSANGGGDYEEAVEVALEDAIHDHNWSQEARARLLFLVLDAPPHETEENVQKLQKLAADAAEKGIRIIPVASSGVDKNTEFLMRFLSIATGGTYIFLTDHSGVGNEHIEPTIGQYEVEALNDLLVRVVSHYIED